MKQMNNIKADTSPALAPVEYAVMKSALGDIAIAEGPQGLLRIALPSQLELRPFPEEWRRNDNAAMAAQNQLAEYFNGSRQQFDLTLDLQGTDFQQAVWRGLQALPYGTVCSYGELATQIKRPSAVRAVGAANGRNPLPIVVPCHRVIGANGKLTGYFGGEGIKQKLLALEAN